MQTNSLEEINVKIDFKRKSQINFGMTFIITNYMDEILYVNKHGELRCKPLDGLSPSDSIKFKLVDLSNPTNPGALQYGEAMWLQNLDVNDSADHSFHSGHVLTSKLFGPPQLKAVQFDMPPPPAELPASGHQTALAAARSAARGVGASQTEATTEDEAAEDGGPKPLPRRDRHSVLRDSFANQDTVRAEERKQRIESNTANVCGSMEVCRIVGEVKRGDDLLGERGASDEKVSRYNSKQATVLGKWTVHSALREETQRLQRGRKGEAVPQPLAKKENRFVYSLSPIVIQQDLYCISTTSSAEYRNWPKNSDSIVNKDDPRNPKHPKAAPAAGSRPDSATQQPAGKHPAASPSAPPASQQLRGVPGSLLSTLNSMDSGFHQRHLQQQHHAHYQPGDPLDSPHSHAAHLQAAAAGQQEEEDGDSDDSGDYGCIRKLVSRGFPYDFSVDRRCVWKFCLFEQFTGETVTSLSDKERISHHVMETATMVLKRSKMNREGERLHSSGQAGDLPPLKGGEQFSKTLRFIVHKRALRKEAEMLHDRRSKEVNLRSYIAYKIEDVLAAAEADPLTARKAAASNSSRSLSGEGSVTTKTSFGSHTLLSDSSPALPGGSVTFVTSARHGSPSRPARSSRRHGQQRLTDSSSACSLSSSGNEVGPHPLALRTSSLQSSSFEALYGRPASHAPSPLQAPSKPGSALARSRLSSPDESPDPARLDSPPDRRQALSADSQQESSGLGQEIQDVFRSQARRLETRHLLLNRPEALNHYDRLSDGEKVLALHKTFSHLRKVTESDLANQLSGGLSVVRTPKYGNRGKTAIDWAMVAQRQAQMMQEDERIKEVLSYKDRVEKDKEISELLKLG